MSDVADLCSEVGRNRVHGIGEVLPGTSYARHDSLTAETAVGADLAGHTSDLRSKRAELIRHRVHGFLELQNLPAHVDGDFLGPVAVTDPAGHHGTVTN